MTEDEAKTKWCPFAKAWECGGNSWSTKPLDSVEDTGMMTNEKTLCIASACMAWRETKAVGTEWLPNVNNLGETKNMIPAEGYCGLAGRPE